MTSSGSDSSAPTIDTARLRLRAPTPNDFEAACQLWAHPDVYRYTGGSPGSREEVWRRLLANAGTWALLGYGSWAVEQRSDGAYLGQVGFLHAMREMQPPFGADEVEAGWALAPAAHGRGVASEAVGAALEWADAHLPGRPIVCIVSPGNAPSLKVASKFGFRERARGAYHGEPTIQFERTRA
jgi:RimJ/RimL family protein N-acetyltransferase